MENSRGINDFEDILRESELDSAKMILRLASELREKELELGSLRSQSFEEIQRNNKAKEAEFEALIGAQEERIKKREQEIGRLLVEKEAHLWQKYQKMLEEAISAHRGELEEERAKLNSEIARKETEIIEQKKALRLDMEVLFKKWEAEREADFKNERETFIEELKLGRETARKEAEDRAEQFTKLWKEKLDQTRADLAARHSLEIEEIKRKAGQEHMAEINLLNDRHSAELALKEEELRGIYAKWLADHKKLSEDNFSKSLAQAEADYSGRAAGLEETLKKTEEDLARRQALWENKYEELKKFYSRKEAALEAAIKESEGTLLDSEKELAGRYARLEKDLLAKIEQQKLELAKKEKSLDTDYAGRLAELQAGFAAREKSLNEKEKELAAKREELNLFGNQVTEVIHQREAELADAFEERYNLLRHSLEESSRIKEQGLIRKYEEIQKQCAILSGQKKAALANSASVSGELEDLKKTLAEKDAYLRTMEEKETAKTAQLRKTFETEFAQKTLTVKNQMAETEKELKKAYEDRLRTEIARITGEFHDKEAGLAAQREVLNAQAAELENKFAKSLKDKETEAAENFKTALAGMTAQLEALRRAKDEELARLKADYEDRFKKTGDRLSQTLQDTRRQAIETTRRQAELELHSVQDSHQIKIRELENHLAMLEHNLGTAASDKAALQEQLLGLKAESEIMTRKLDEAQTEKQQLIQENLSKARDLRQTIEKEFTEKLAAVEKNYLGQLADTIRASKDMEHARQAEYFQNLELLKQEYGAKMDKQAKEMEDAYTERESKLRAALEERYKLKEKALATRYEQMERSYTAAISDKNLQLDTDRAMADSIHRLQEELETRNRELNSKILSYDSKLETARKAIEADYAARIKEMQDAALMKTDQLENERAKLKGVLAQEARLVSELQKREAALQENYARKEAELVKEFSLSRERLEKDYQEKLKTIHPGGAAA